MAYKLECPSCGAAIDVKNKGSLFIVCPYCATTSNRKDQDLESYGKTAELMDDGSALQLGTTGKVNGKPFDIIGRIQLQLSGGFWNEWYIQDQNGEGAWIGEAQGFLTLTKIEEAGEELPAHVSLEPGKAIDIAGHSLEVKEIVTAKCIAGEGELPFSFEPGYEAPSVDLVDEDGNVATIDYSEEPPLFFFGKNITFDDFHFANLKDDSVNYYESGESGAKNIECKGCGASIQMRAEGFSKSLVCEYCGSVLDATHPDHSVVDKLKQIVDNKRKPIVELGAEAVFSGSEYPGHEEEKKYEHLGFMERYVKYDGEYYYWREYLFITKDRARQFLWLIESDGHWNIVKTQNKKITFPERVYGRVLPAHVNGRSYKHFSKSKAYVSYVAGEFYWQVKSGEKVKLDDFTSPPYVLSCEKTQTEINWSEGRYVHQSEIAKALGLKVSDLPEQSGINICQPNPHEGRAKFYKRAWLVFAALYVAMAVFFVAKSENKPVVYKVKGGVVYPQSYWYNPLKVRDKKNKYAKNYHWALMRAPHYGTDPVKRPFNTKLFYLSKGKKNLEFEMAVPHLKNSWAYFNMLLVPHPDKNKKTCRGKAGSSKMKTKNVKSLNFSQSIEYYSGYDWSEGSKTADFSIPSVEGGCYHLWVDSLFDPKITKPIKWKLLIKRDSPGVSGILWALIFLAFPLAWNFFKVKAFEGKRWADSDYSG